MNNKTISQFFDIADENSTIIDMRIEGGTKFIVLEKNLDHNRLCPLCGHKLHSKGKFTRHPNNQILQDGYTLDLTLIGRRWKCTNPECSHTCSDQFDFVEKRKRNTQIIIYLILFELKDIQLSCRQVARRFNVSDTYVHQQFMRYINIPRKKLTKYICIDEVYLNTAPDCKYAMVIMDFITGDVLDIIRSRRKTVTESYFLSIPREERAQVEFLCCDMYQPYINYTSGFLWNAQPCIDSFHVLKWLLNLINNYIITVRKRYQKRDRELLKEKNLKSNKDYKTMEESREVYILRKASWVLLRNPSNWFYVEPRYNTKLRRYMDTYDWEREFLALDENFTAIRNLKDLYEEFNENFVNDLDGAAKRLDELIEIYSQSNIYIFRQFADLLKKFHDPIVNSFTYAKSEEIPEAALRRLSNGPLESFNNIPSALRSQSHGISNFEFARNRMLWTIREDAAIRFHPRSDEEIHTTGKKRGPYKNKNNI